MIARGLSRFLRDASGSIGPLMALLMVPIIGAMAMGMETSSWFLLHRAQQNTADSSVLAAAQKGASGYAAEARAVASKYGYAGSSTVTVTPAVVTCPAGAPVISGSSCYQVTVTDVIPLYLSRIVGFNGDVALGSGRGKTITALAVAGTVSSDREYCIIGMTDITINGGGSKPDFQGCDFLSGGGMRCNGVNSSYGVVHGDAYGTNGTGGGTNTCGTSPRSSMPFGGDPYADTVNANIASLSGASCVAGGTITTLHSGVNCFNGPVTLGGNISVTNPDTVLLIKNGGLDISNKTLSTAAGASLTIVYSGTKTDTPVLASNGGILDIAAPSSGDWKGYLFVEDPALQGKTLPGGVNSRDVSFSGSSSSKITFRVTGLFYLPHAKFDIGGAINHATNSDYDSFVGQNCLNILADQVLLAGTVALYDNPTKDCDKVGTGDTPTVPLIALLR